jgi:RNA polymerase sigma factor (sigma-70 family)
LRQQAILKTARSGSRTRNTSGFDTDSSRPISFTYPPKQTMKSGSQFPATRWSVVLQAGDIDSEVRARALEDICRAYWMPVYAFARGQGVGPEDAEDLTQDVLAGLLKAEAFASVGPEKGQLRNFLRVVTKNTLRNNWRKSRRQKRGGAIQKFSLDHAAAEASWELEAADGESPDRIFDRHWGISLLQRTMERLESSYARDNKQPLFAALRDVLGRGGGPRYQDLAAQLGMNEGAVKVAVHRLRQRYRTLLREEIALTLDDDSEAAVEAELRHLFGVFSC